jgi:hypothetical protein
MYPGCSKEKRAARFVLAFVRTRIEVGAAPPQSWARVMLQFQLRYGGVDEAGPSLPVEVQAKIPPRKMDGLAY